MSDIILKIQNLVEEHFKENEIVNSQEKSVEVRKISDALGQKLLQNQPVKSIQAPNIVVEVIDKETGQLYRRYLEVAYEESSTGLMLKGEDIAGEEAIIAFLSQSGIEKIYELRGDVDVTHDHDSDCCDNK